MYLLLSVDMYLALCDTLWWVTMSHSSFYEDQEYPFKSSFHPYTPLQRISLRHYFKIRIIAPVLKFDLVNSFCRNRKLKIPNSKFAIMVVVQKKKNEQISVFVHGTCNIEKLIESNCVEYSGNIFFFLISKQEWNFGNLFSYQIAQYQYFNVI